MSRAIFIIGFLFFIFLLGQHVWARFDWGIKSRQLLFVAMKYIAVKIMQEQKFPDCFYQ